MSLRAHEKVRLSAPVYCSQKAGRLHMRLLLVPSEWQRVTFYFVWAPRSHFTLPFSHRPCYFLPIYIMHHVLRAKGFTSIISDMLANNGFGERSNFRKRFLGSFPAGVSTSVLLLRGLPSSERKSFVRDYFKQMPNSFSSPWGNKVVFV